MKTTQQKWTPYEYPPVSTPRGRLRACLVISFGLALFYATIAYALARHWEYGPLLAASVFGIAFFFGFIGLALGTTN